MVEFKNGLAVGWAFGVIRAFRVGTSAAPSGPSRWNFAAGHLFYDPPEARAMVWGDALAILRRSIQILETSGATPENEQVTFVLTHYSGGKKTHAEERTCSRDEFEHFLRVGDI